MPLVPIRHAVSVLSVAIPVSQSVPRPISLSRILSPILGQDGEHVRHLSSSITSVRMARSPAHRDVD